MVTSRAGRSTLGCLFMLLLLVTGVYFVFNLAEPHWRYYQFRDAMSQAARFADDLSDAEITRQLHAKADSLGLPPEAYSLRFNRTANTFIIWTEYSELVELPGFSRTFVFRPRVEQLR